jgi:hypothetical protein
MKTRLALLALATGCAMASNAPSRSAPTTQAATRAQHDEQRTGEKHRERPVILAPNTLGRGGHPHELQQRTGRAPIMTIRLRHEHARTEAEHRDERGNQRRFTQRPGVERDDRAELQLQRRLRGGYPGGAAKPLVLPGVTLVAGPADGLVEGHEAKPVVDEDEDEDEDERPAKKGKPADDDDDEEEEEDERPRRGTRR